MDKIKKFIEGYYFEESMRKGTALEQTYQLTTEAWIGKDNAVALRIDYHSIKRQFLIFIKYIFEYILPDVCLICSLHPSSFDEEFLQSWLICILRCFCVYIVHWPYEEC